MRTPMTACEQGHRVPLRECDSLTNRRKAVGGAARGGRRGAVRGELTGILGRPLKTMSTPANIKCHGNKRVPGGGV